MTARVRKRRAPTRDAPTRTQINNTRTSAARVHRHSRSFQMCHIRTLTLVGNTASRPIRHALTQEKLTNNIQDSVNHCISPHSINRAPPIRRADTKNARTPHTKGAHATLTRQTIARQRPRTQPRGRRQRGEIHHIKGKGRAPEYVRRARPQMLHLHVAGQDIHTIAHELAHHATRQAPPLRYTRLTRQREQQRHQTMR